jgi:cytosine/adenosine deaminase-related metal-dependent hydrolase
VSLTSRITHYASRFTHHQPLYLTNITILNPVGPAGHSLRIEGGRIAAINSPPRKHDLIIDGQGGLLIPGLINAHDHLELNTFKRLKYRDSYIHSVQWIEDIEARFDSDPDLVGPRNQPLTDRLWVSALKNLLSGVTTVCHHNPLYRPLRRNYPIRVVRDYNFHHSLFKGDNPGASYKKTKPHHPWIIHLAEGIDDIAAAEFDRLDALGAVGPNTVLVHGVGLTATQRQTLIERGGGLIWCPGSNNFMFGQTAQVEELAEAGKLALGSDSRLSGEFDLLNELKVAAKSGQLSPQGLFQTVTTGAARVLRLPNDGRGQLVVGGLADLVLLPPPTNDDYFAHLLSLSRSQLDLVMVGGKPLAGSPQMQSLFEATKTKYTPVVVDGVEKLMARRVASRLEKSSMQESGVVVRKRPNL